MDADWSYIVNNANRHGSSDRDTEVYAAQGNMAGTSAVPRLNNSSKNKTFYVDGKTA